MPNADKQEEEEEARVTIGAILDVYEGKMPRYCAAWSCFNKDTYETRSRGITFHMFPKDKVQRKLWETALKREKFSATSSTALCSEHFRQEDFDRTGQTVRIRHGVIPSVFQFPAHLQKPVATRSTKTSMKAQQSLKMEHSVDFSVQQKHDHSYAIPSSPAEMINRLHESLARAKKENRNAKDRERRARQTLCSLLEDLREKRIINEELKERLDLYSGKMQI